MVVVVVLVVVVLQDSCCTSDDVVGRTGVDGSAEVPGNIPSSFLKTLSVKDVRLIVAILNSCNSRLLSLRVCLISLVDDCSSLMALSCWDNWSWIPWFALAVLKVEILVFG